jgi:hypothetical protein
MPTSIKPYNLRIYPGCDWTLAARKPVCDSGKNPLQGIKRRFAGLEGVRRYEIEYESRDRDDTYGELVRKFELIDQWITLVAEKRIDEFSPPLTLLFEKSNRDLGVLQSGLWRQFYEIVDAIERLKHAGKPRAKRGSKGISPKARKKVRSAVTILQQRHGKKNLSFITYTIPTCDRDTLYKICDQWSEIVRQTQQNLRRLLISKNLDPDVCGAIEIQSERFERTGYALPHMHLVCQGRTPKSFANRYQWDCSIPEFEDCYRRAIENVAGRVMDFRAACNVQRVKKNAANYLGKYLSKGSKDLESWGEKLPLPTAWYTCTKELMHEVTSKIRNIAVDGNWVDFARALDKSPYLVYKADFAIQNGATVALFGRCRTDCIDRFESDFLKRLQEFSEFLQLKNKLAC